MSTFGRWVYRCGSICVQRPEAVQIVGMIVVLAGLIYAFWET